MGNFDFVRDTLPAIHDDCIRAESYLATDPRAVCFYARRVVEEVVNYLYDVRSLRVPYRDDLAAKIGDAAFRTHVPDAITQKLTGIRKIANTAVHENRQIRPDVASVVLRELFHVVVWTSYHHSPRPDVVPLQAQFDPALAKNAAPLSRAELAQLAAKFEQQDKDHTEQLAARDDLIAAHEAEIAQIRAKITAATAAARPDDRDYDEASARDLYIDQYLHEAGWLLEDKRDREYEVTGMSDGGKGYVDYVLWGTDGLPLAVVEAKRTKKSPQLGQRQAEMYADCLEKQFGRRPVVFYSNGYEHWLWDDADGYPPREVAGFYTADELELLIWRRTSRSPLTNAAIDAEIAGRDYQVRAIRAVGDAFDRKQRQALLVMATGAGKTRTTIAMTDQMMKANWVKRILFLADRTALVRQATNAFKKHLSAAPIVNLVVDDAAEARVYTSTYPTMMGLINEIDGGVRRFGPGHFDVIVIDEAHRSVYAKYGEIFEYFDSLLVGLTATPKGEVDHNTYRLFNLEDGVPTDAYSLDEAVAAKYLVPPKGIKVGSLFMRSGVKYDDLSPEEQEQWDDVDWGGPPPTEVGAGDMHRILFNEDTVDQVLAKVMTDGYKVAGADRLGKTIIFAKNQKHAEFIEKRFNLAYPHLAGKFARVITSAIGEREAESLIDDFSVKDKAPHIAITVDMLDTGIDVPEVVNLVFFKDVRSKTKFWQMIGRGTRLCPDLYAPGEDKKDFLVFDFCGNLEYFSQNLPGSQGQTQKSLSQRLFETRLGLIGALGGSEPELRMSTTKLLYDIVAGMDVNNFVVRKRRQNVERFSSAEAWEKYTPHDSEAALVLAGLPSSVADDDEAAKRFDLIILRRQLAQLEGDISTAERFRQTVQAIADTLLPKITIPAVAEQAALLEALVGDDWWVDVTLPMLEDVRRRVRGLAQFIEKTTLNPVYTDFKDTLGEAVEVYLPGITPGTDFDRFRSKAEAYLREHLDNIALHRLRRNLQLTEADLGALEEMLLASGAGEKGDIDSASEKTGGLGLFIRSLVGLDRAAASEAFSRFLDGTGFSVVQIRFINLIVDEVTKNGVMEPKRLFESPYTDYAPTGPGDFFFDSDVIVIIETLQQIKQTAVPSDVA